MTSPAGGRVALSGRLRPDVECAPWVLAEVRELESLLTAAESERDALAAGVRALADELEDVASERDIYRADVLSIQKRFVALLAGDGEHNTGEMK